LTNVSGGDIIIMPISEDRGYNVMGRSHIITNRVALHIFINRAVDERLEKFAKEYGWSKTKIIEDAVFLWLNAREKEVS
jgi:hypothetical protein